MGLLMNKINFFAAQEWFEFLREELIKEIELIDGKKFIISNWKHKPSGGGKSSKILGNIIENNAYDDAKKECKC